MPALQRNLMNRKNLCLVYNYAQHYRQEIFQLLDKELGCDFYFGDKMNDVRKLDYRLLDNFQGELTNHWVGSSFYFQFGILKILRRKYRHYIFLGEVRCLSTWMALLFCKFSKSKIHLWTHGWYGKEGTWEKVFKKIFFNLADSVFLYGDYARKLMIREGMDACKLHVIYNSLAYDKQVEIRSKLKFSNVYSAHFNNSHRNLVFVGRLSAVKKLDMIIHAVYDLMNKGEKYNLTFIGSGEESKRLADLSRKLNLADVVWFYGPCYDEYRLADFLYNADLCVSPGNVGLTAIHCMVFGLPVLTHNKYEWQMPEFEAVVEGETGAFFEYGSQKSLENAISNFFEKGFDRENIRQNCYKVIEDRYNPHFQLKVIKDVLDI